MSFIVVAAGVGAASAGYGAIKSGQANKKSQELLDQQKEENDADYNNNANKDFMKTNVAKDAVRELKDNLDDNRKAAAGRGAIAGASDEAQVAGNTGANKVFVDGISRLASNATQYQNQQDALHRQQKGMIFNAQNDIYKQKAADGAALVSSGTSLIGTGLASNLGK